MRAADTRPSILLAAKAAARESGIPYSSLRDAAFRGELPVVKVGGRAWYFKRADLHRWIDSRTESFK